VTQLALTLTAPAVKVGSRVARYCWQEMTL
jgi:hypothetical protein